ncbi:MAG: hypothetical protein LKH12_05415 [Prevotella sp.]|jgi:hypothetical protein|nr:hypothetical protein [Prevotella sp.]MCI1324258.1 hypothetical protein [Prevotella sp.]MCI1349336.1 hypothetical protein [Prevotella sp.]MCI1415945.1 hypothetical protein [Prevotella sp.]MCI1742497.1 hypothetical protein [Prevotella sp.]
MKTNDKTFNVFIYSGFGVTFPIVVVAVAMLLSGYHISSETKFWLWLIAAVSFLVMMLSLIRILCDFMPIDNWIGRLRKQSHSRSLITLEKTVDLSTESQQTEVLRADIAEVDSSLKAYFIRQYVNKVYVDKPVYETYQELFKENNGGKNVVLAFYCGADSNMNWLISIPPHAEATRLFGEKVVGSKNNYSVQKSNLRPGNLDDKKLVEIRAMKQLMKKIMAHLQE